LSWLLEIHSYLSEIQSIEINGFLIFNLLKVMM
jgi:hypothetical protein